MMKVYAMLIRRYMDELQYLGWNGSLAHLDNLKVAQENYSTRMDNLYERLSRDYGFSREKFYALQEQSQMF